MSQPDIAVASARWVQARLAYADAYAEFAAAVRELRDAGMSEVELAAEFNTTRTTIRHVLGKPRRRI